MCVRALSPTKYETAENLYPVGFLLLSCSSFFSECGALLEIASRTVKCVALCLLKGRGGGDMVWWGL